MILDFTAKQLGINNADYLCLVQLTRLSNDKNITYVSQTALAKRLSKTRMSTNTSIKNLEKAGLIKITNLATEQGGRLANSYTLLLDKWASIANCDVEALVKSSTETLEGLQSRFMGGAKLNLLEMQRLVDANILKPSDEMLLKALIMREEEKRIDATNVAKE
ncbi:hypothetical protein B5G52_04110 [Pseudoalteromonas sp. A601]|uniref:helix-turn-helix domain-containing protein n=1 Tax=Pseudoalteromonas sp. A601 TaxID=1967839 RepID=UPI000B3BF3EF|nr:helix-turn-helix domain-containing protein [Pseudoalteromonas sp. A601]OUS73437.1 hypothetical protein B5G52_04110 [Pseudoalteromonas sp. A601]